MSMSTRSSSDDLPDRLRTWAELDRIEAVPVLRADLTEAADKLANYERMVGFFAVEPPGDLGAILDRAKASWDADESVPIQWLGVVLHLRAAYDEIQRLQVALEEAIDVALEERWPKPEPTREWSNGEAVRQALDEFFDELADRVRRSEGFPKEWLVDPDG
jgi:hypothetical protein